MISSPILIVKNEELAGKLVFIIYV